jgi:hypothetical protein
MQTQQVAGSTEQLLWRICGEYLEMPGLHLTCAQAERLWGLDAHVCQSLFDVLVNLRFLRRTKDGAYWRLTEGRGASLPCGPRSFCW